MSRVHSQRALCWRIQSRLAVIYSTVGTLPALHPDPEPPEVLVEAEALPPEPPAAEGEGAVPYLVERYHDWVDLPDGPFGAKAGKKCTRCLVVSKHCRNHDRDFNRENCCVPIRIRGLGLNAEPPPKPAALAAERVRIAGTLLHGTHLLYHRLGTVVCISCAGYLSAHGKKLKDPCKGELTSKGECILRRLGRNETPHWGMVWPLTDLVAPDAGFVDMASLPRVPA